MNGIILIDKGSGITSMSVDVCVRKTLNIRKAGHLGTLDPFATGMLPVFAGDALKVLRYCEDFDKCYICTARFGYATDTLDCDGDIIAENYPDGKTMEELERTDYKAVREAFSKIESITSQMPPKFSAKKIGGKKAYELARLGRDDVLEKSLKPHKVKIHSIDIINISRWEKGFDVKFRVSCSKGTYIRTIADDVGKATGFYATAMSLRRIKEGPFDIGLAVTEEKMKEMAAVGDYSFILPTDTALEHIPKIMADAKTADDISHGRKVPIERFSGQNVPLDCPRFRVMYNDKMLAVVTPSEDNGRKFMKCERVFVG